MTKAKPNFIFLALFTILLSFAANTLAQQRFYATLEGSQEVPPVTTAATGSGTVDLNAAETEVTVNLTFDNLGSNQVAGHIHAAAPRGSNAGILFGIGSSGMTNGTFGPLVFSVTAQQVADLKAGLWYFNVHSENNGGGEIRGQIEPSFKRFTASLDGSQETMPNSSTATGTGSVDLNPNETEVTVNLSFSGLSTAQTGGHIHSPAPRGSNAGVLFSIGSNGMTADSFGPMTFDVTAMQVEDLKNGLWYFNVHSTMFPGGEIRGQIESVTFSLSGRVLDSNGNGVPYAGVEMTDEVGNTQIAITNSFGFFTFSNAPSGQMVDLIVNSKKFNYSPQSVTVQGNVTNLEFEPAVMLRSSRSRKFK